MEDKRQSPGEKGSEPQTEQSKTWSLAVTILALLKQDSKKMQQQLKAISKTNRQLACTLLTTEVDGWTPAHACALRGSKKLMKAVVRTGVAVNSTMGQPEGLPAGCTLLHVAANRKDKKIVNYLLQQGANVNAVDSNHFTALDYATTSENKEVVRLLLSWGAISFNAGGGSNNNNNNSSDKSPSPFEATTGDSSKHVRRGRSPVKSSTGKSRTGPSGDITAKQQEQQRQQQQRLKHTQHADQGQFRPDGNDFAGCQKTQLLSPPGLAGTCSGTSSASPESHQNPRQDIGASQLQERGRSRSDVDARVKKTLKSVTSRLRPSSLFFPSPRPFRRAQAKHTQPSPSPDRESLQIVDKSEHSYPPQDTNVPQSRSCLQKFHPRPRQHQEGQLQPNQTPRFLSNQLHPSGPSRLFSSTPCLLDSESRPASDCNPVAVSQSDLSHDDNNNNSSSTDDQRVDRGPEKTESGAMDRRRCNSSENILESNGSDSLRIQNLRRSATSSPLIVTTDADCTSDMATSRRASDTVRSTDDLTRPVVRETSI